MLCEDFLGNVCGVGEDFIVGGCYAVKWGCFNVLEDTIVYFLRTSVVELSIFCNGFFDGLASMFGGDSTSLVVCRFGYLC